MVKRETVKINVDLLKRINLLIKDKDKKIIYATAKQFVDIAVLKLLQKEEKIGNDKFKSE
ncbi:MAG: hypothetical protein AABY22_01725 [Nanoarchaeota archaeon]